MHTPSKSRRLPRCILCLGILGCLIRCLLYAVAPDSRGLLPRNHPLELSLMLLSAAAVLLAALGAWQRKGSSAYADNFSPSLPAAVGHLCAAGGIALTVLLYPPAMDGYLGLFWTVLGLAAPVCLMVAGFFRLQGQKPSFVLHTIPCLFLVLHVVNHYRAWTRDPQLQDCMFDLFAMLALMFFAYYAAAFDVGVGRRRMHLFSGLCALYLCLVALSGTDYPPLYLGGAVWALTDLCTLTPKPVPPEKPEPDHPKGV